MFYQARGYRHLFPHQAMDFHIIHSGFQCIALHGCAEITFKQHGYTEASADDCFCRKASMESMALNVAYLQFLHFSNVVLLALPCLSPYRNPNFFFSIRIECVPALLHTLKMWPLVTRIFTGRYPLPVDVRCRLRKSSWTSSV